MPRGRPPILRTKEEALNARREQVRKNVQAFRRRKFELCIANGGEDGMRSIQEARPLAAKASHQIEHNLEKDQIVDTASHQQRSNSQAESVALISSSGFEDVYFPFLLPQEIDAARMSLQQFVANAATTFVLGNSSEEIGLHWSQTIPSLVNTNPILDLSFQAVCLMQISTINGEQHLAQKSMTAYSRALKSLQQVVAKTNAQFSIEIYVATMTLSGYELLQGNVKAQSRNWINHVEGAISYLNSFPTSSSTKVACSHQVSFHSLECICIFDALGARRPSCFSTSKWWQTSVAKFADDDYGALLRLITVLPSFLEQSDKIVARPDIAETVVLSRTLFDSFRLLEGDFLAWFDRTRQRLPAFQLVDTVLTRATKSNTNYEFPNLNIARLYLLYWSSMVLLLSSIATLQSKLASSRISTSVTTFPCLGAAKRYASRAHTFALNVRYSIHYCLRPRHGLVGKTSALLPLWIARNSLRDFGDIEARAWCDGVLEGLGQQDLSFGLRVEITDDTKRAAALHAPQSVLCKHWSPPWTSDFEDCEKVCETEDL